MAKKKPTGPRIASTPTVDAQKLYEEFRDDPQDIGYKIGSGVSFNDKYLPTGDRFAPDDTLKSINGFRTTITVSVNVKPRPGVISTLQIPMQALRQVLNVSEYRANYDDTNGAKEIALFEHLTCDGDSWLATDDSISQMRQILNKTRWGDEAQMTPEDYAKSTRGRFENLLETNGTRAEQLWGGPPAPVTRQHMLKAQDYAQKNSLPSLYE